jgi:choice-of-anchor A domain-containing protein
VNQLQGLDLTPKPDSPSEPRIFWNLPSADSLEFTGTQFRGYVIALDATTEIRGQSGEGGYWVRELRAKDSNW